MEYDNDRIRKPVSRVEIFSWVLLIVLGPATNSLLIFPASWWMWPVLLVLSLMIWPAYLFYSLIMGAAFLFQKRWWLSLIMIALSFLMIMAFQFGVYSLINRFDLRPAEHVYFTFTTSTFIREGWWAIVNLSIATGITVIRRWLKEQELIGNLQKDNTFFKLRYLRAQLNPHFLFNTLNSIYSLSMQKSDKAPETVVRLADIMRYLIYECNEEKIPLEKEIEFIRNYIEIEQTRYKADIRFTVEGLTNGIMIEPFIFISFIENGFKHAMENSFTDPFIYITLKVGDGRIVLNVINSTQTDLESQAKRINGKGISNSKSILELLYPDAYELDIIQTEKGESRESALRMRHARDRLETLYPDAYTLDVITSKSSFTVSLILKSRA
jgi:sensor histidine kinase YesM